MLKNNIAVKNYEVLIQRKRSSPKIWEDSVL
jgi:hypothetical protein